MDSLFDLQRADKYEQGDSSPVLIIAYNRADTFSNLLASLSFDCERRIYVFCDGPRNQLDKAQQRQMIAEVKKHRTAILRTSEKHLGCKVAVETGIDWVLGLHPTVIVLEDDLLPHPDFLAFCDSKLLEFRDDHRIQQISGSNALGHWSRVFTRGRLIFLPVPNVSGWATWRSRWSPYREKTKYGQVTLGASVTREWTRYGLSQRWNEIMEQAKESLEGRLDAWDYPWAAWGIGKGLATIVPPVNLIEHHGIGNRATHTKEGRFVSSRGLPSMPRKRDLTRIEFEYERIGLLLETFWWIRRKIRRGLAQVIVGLLRR